jgi:hypothetical protein
MRKSVPNNQIRALAMAMGGAIVAAVATMFIPASVLEGITGSTGLSELVPATAAPLGDTARAIFAFGAGAFTLAILAFILLRQESPPAKAAIVDPYAPPPLEDEALSLKDRLSRVKFPQFAMPKMPWVKGEDDITDLADLPKLKNGDIHPDAPPRRPLSATQDLPVLDLAEIAIGEPILVEGAVEVADAAIVANRPLVEDSPVVIAEAEAPVAVITQDAQPTLAEMVAQLESAVAERQKQLAELEGVAAKLAAERPAMPVETPVVQSVEIISDADVTIEPARSERPPLEAVPASPVKDDDMDSALAAALATLHRMNGTGR